MHHIDSNLAPQGPLSTIDQEGGGGVQGSDQLSGIVRRATEKVKESQWHCAKQKLSPSARSHRRQPATCASATRKAKGEIGKHHRHPDSSEMRAPLFLGMDSTPRKRRRINCRILELISPLLVFFDLSIRISGEVQRGQRERFPIPAQHSVALLATTLLTPMPAGANPPT
jgi:hypothetical protein